MKTSPLLCHRRYNKITTTASLAAFFFIPYFGRKPSGRLRRKWAEEKTVSRTRWGCVLPVMTERGGIFSPSLRPPPSLRIPLRPNDANKIPIPLTHLVPACRQHASSRLLKRPKWLQMAELVVFLDVREYRCWERLRDQARRCVAGWAEWSRASAWGHTLVPHRII